MTLSVISQLVINSSKLLHFSMIPWLGSASDITLMVRFPYQQPDRGEMRKINRRAGPSHMPLVREFAVANGSVTGAVERL